jgi:hypothetical protein
MKIMIYKCFVSDSTQHSIEKIVRNWLLDKVIGKLLCGYNNGKKQSHLADFP